MQVLEVIQKFNIENIELKEKPQIDEKKIKVYPIAFELLKEGQILNPYAKIIKAGNWKKEDWLILDKATLKEMVENYHKGLTGTVWLNIDHVTYYPDMEKPKSLNIIGEVVDMRYIEKKGTIAGEEKDNVGYIVATANIINKEIAEKVKSGLLRYVSAEFSLNWINPETGKGHKVILGVGLTNFAYYKALKPIKVLFSETIQKGGEVCMNLIELMQKSTLTQEEHDRAVELIEKIEGVEEQQMLMEELAQKEVIEGESENKVVVSNEDGIIEENNIEEDKENDEKDESENESKDEVETEAEIEVNNENSDEDNISSDNISSDGIVEDTEDTTVAFDEIREQIAELGTKYIGLETKINELTKQLGNLVEGLEEFKEKVKKDTDGVKIKNFIDTKVSEGKLRPAVTSMVEKYMRAELRDVELTDEVLEKAFINFCGDGEKVNILSEELGITSNKFKDLTDEEINKLAHKRAQETGKSFAQALFEIIEQKNRV